ncbi:thiamine pyrophosphate-dependent enzyme [Aeromicrobium sp.]|uniref:thiamine pyrophosphate-dependent enzyme n=1 Tax=Aeromicrobium sp. TaxID=1871063 RepID=UPI003C440002
MTRVSVREATFEAMRRQDMTTIFSNPGSTEVSFLADLPDDLRFVLALHEGSVVGIATGHAIASREPAFVLLHTTAGLGNAVGAIATARVNRAPLVVVVGQQDRRHLALEPFLAGKLDGLAGVYPLDVLQPAAAQDVPSAIERAAHTARDGQGPVIVIVPMDDWDASVDPGVRAAATRVVRAPAASVDVGDLTDLVESGERPVIVAGAGNDYAEGWAALTSLAERLGAPVWQEPFGARAGFPQDHALYQGQLPSDRAGVRTALDGHDLVLVVGTALLRQYAFADGPLLPDGMRAAVVTADLDEARRSPAELVVIGDPAVVVRSLIDRVREREQVGTEPIQRPTADRDDDFRAATVFAALDRLLGPDAVVVEETPSTRPILEDVIVTRRPLGFVSAAMGGLGFALPAAIGLRMAMPDRPVVAVVGDGSSLYSIQSLWTAVDERVGALFVVLANGRYAVMDRLAERHGGTAPWPAFPEVSVSGLAASLGCPSLRVEDLTSLEGAVSGFEPSAGPLLVEVVVPVEETFAP